MDLAYQFKIFKRCIWFNLLGLKIKKLLVWFSGFTKFLQFAKGLPTPMIGGEKLSAFGNDSIEQAQQYRSLVGTL